MAKIILRKSIERGAANHGWLDSHHTFSFAGYYDSRFNGYGSLRVINEDVVDPGTGFGKHPHREFEIFSYIISGELEHKDSLGHTELLHRGDIQHTTTGTGIAHSEYNVHPTDKVHFLQIWAKPNKARLSPAYVTRTFSEAEKTGQFRRVVAPIEESEEDGAIGINANVAMWATILPPGETATLETGEARGRKYYLHAIQSGGEGVLRVGKMEQNISPGDGAFIEGVKENEKITLTSTGDKTIEAVLFGIDD